MSRFLRDLGLLVLSVLAAISVLLILVNPGAEPGLAVDSSTGIAPTTSIAPTTIASDPPSSTEPGEVTPVLSISNRGALCSGGLARFTVTLQGPGALDPGRAAIEVSGVPDLAQVELDPGEVTTDPPSAVWAGTHLFEAAPDLGSIVLRVVRVDGPPLPLVELDEPCR